VSICGAGGFGGKPPGAGLGGNPPGCFSFTARSCILGMVDLSSCAAAAAAALSLNTGFSFNLGTGDLLGEAVAVAEEE
jgi:hypothetical protein